VANTERDAEPTTAIGGERLRDAVFELIGELRSEELQRRQQRHDGRGSSQHGEADLPPAMHHGGF
jgi:hypothetical protein